MACNPKDLLPVMDFTPEEAALYPQLHAEDYRTFEVEIDGFQQGRAIGGAFEENLEQWANDRPCLYFKRDADSNFYVLYVNANRGTSNETIEQNIREDIAKAGGVVKQVSHAENWRYFPHVEPSAIADQYYSKAWNLQGKNDTVGAGASWAFDDMPEAREHAVDIARRLMKNDLPGVGNGALAPSEEE
jgi:hypothetical protein